MPYNINYSDPSNADTILVPDMPPGINTVDTSLSLVGRGYPNYGQKIAENFVHLLENFASPIPPSNPIEGQLWYDTSDSNNKVLRIMDGTASSTRWPSANGIYQQPIDPKVSSTQGLKIGDIWVDTENYQLNIFKGDGNWEPVGYTSTGTNGQTGPLPEVIVDNSRITEHDVIKNYVSGNIVSIVASETFIPLSPIPGFTVLKPGINLSTSIDNNTPAPILNGTALSAKNLVDTSGLTIPANNVLRKDDQSPTGQAITGKVKFIIPTELTTLTAQGNFGVIIANTSTVSNSDYLQLYKGDNDAILLNNVTNGKIVFKTKSNNLSTVMELDNSNITLYSDTTITKPLTISNTSTTSLVVGGGTSIGGNLLVAGTLTVLGGITGSIAPTGASSFAVPNQITPTGTIMAFGSNTSIPNGWLLCDGSEYPVASYQELFAVIGFNYGGSGIKFKLPNYVTVSASGHNIYHIIKV